MAKTTLTCFLEGLRADPEPQAREREQFFITKDFSPTNGIFIITIDKVAQRALYTGQLYVLAEALKGEAPSSVGKLLYSWHLSDSTVRGKENS